MSPKVELWEADIIEILRKNRELEIIYRTALINVENEELEAFFRRKSIEHSEFQARLQKAMKEMNPHIKNYSKSQKLSNPWIKARTFTAATDKEPIFEELVRIDALAIEEYDRLIKQGNLPFEISEILRKRTMAISTELSRLKKPPFF